MRIIALFLVTTALLLSCKKKTEKNDKSDPLLARIDTVFDLAVQQYKYLGSQLQPGRYPRTYHAATDSLETSDSGWWCSGFYPGSLLYLSEAVGDPSLKTKADSVLVDLKKEQYNTYTHDLGFMMYCSFGNANRQTPNPEYEQVLLQSAKSLISRYNDTTKVIRSWDGFSWDHAADDDFVVIIDNMMNLELLFWATKYSKDSTYYDIAINHANTTIKNHFRPDNSSYHVLIYDEDTGAIKTKVTAQGAADESAWARGQAWGLYGFTVMYRETKDIRYLQQAQHIVDFLLEHSNMPEDHIPYWDFNAPDIPDALRDSSAGAIMTSALLELCKYTEGVQANKYLEAARIALTHLLTPEYVTREGENGGFLLKHGVGHFPANSEVDVPLSYGDYYLIEAMLRYKNLSKS